MKIYCFGKNKESEFTLCIKRFVILSCLLRDYHKDINSGNFCDDLYKFNNIFMPII